MIYKLIVNGGGFLGILDRFKRKVDEETKIETTQKIAVGMVGISQKVIHVSGGMDKYDGYAYVGHELRDDFRTNGKTEVVTISVRPQNEVAGKEFSGSVFLRTDNKNRNKESESHYKTKKIAEFEPDEKYGIKFNNLKVSEKELFGHLDSVLKEHPEIENLHEVANKKGLLKGAMDFQHLRNLEYANNRTQEEYKELDKMPEEQRLASRLDNYKKLEQTVVFRKNLGLETKISEFYTEQMKEALGQVEPKEKTLDEKLAEAKAKKLDMIRDVKTVERENTLE